MHSKRRVQGKLDLEYYTCNLMFEVLLQVVLKSNFMLISRSGKTFYLNKTEHINAL